MVSMSMSITAYFSGVIRTFFQRKIAYCEVNRFTDDFRLVVEPDLCDVEKGLW